MLFRTLGWKCALLATVAVLVMGAASRAAADSILLEWDSSSTGLVGYRVHVGTQAGSYSQHFDVGSQTLFTFPTAVAGQRYCFAVSAYLLSTLLEGPNSGEVCGYSNAPPVLTNPGNRTSTVGQAVTLQLVGSDPASQPLTYSATGLPPGLNLMSSTGFISGTPTTAGTFNVTATASDGQLTDSESFTWTVTGSGSSSDTTPPTATITGPTSGSTYSTTSSSLALSGTASDNVGVTQVRWSNDRGGNGTATGTTNWSVSGIPLSSGANIIAITAVDAAGNQGTDYLTVTYTTSSTGDTTRPSVTITYPTTSSPSYSSSAMSLSGTATDNVGVTQVRWANDRGGTGVASGTGAWVIPSLALVSGANVITITAVDAAGNQGTTFLTATYSAPGAPPPPPPPTTSDATAPTATITGPTTGATWSTTSSSLSLSGTAADNVGVTQVRWSNDRGGNGVATGTTNWSVSGIPLSSGANNIWITAVDAAGNQGMDQLAVTYTTTSSGDTTRPTVIVTYPTTSSPSYSEAAMSLSGTASDNVGVTQVRWANNRGGSGIASGTGGWVVPSLPLFSGSNVITITAVDAAGNVGTTSLTATYGSSGTPTPPPPSTDTTPPTATITGPTSGATWSTTSSSLSMNGTASDNVGVTQVRWSNDRGGNGVASGTTSWSVAGIPLYSGTNIITITAVDGSGYQGTDTLTVTYTTTTSSGDTTRPTVAITYPSVASPRYTTPAMSMSGTASDNVGVTQVRWSNDRGGSGVAIGTQGWLVMSIALSSGPNVITVTAVDAAGNTGTTAITVNYSPSNSTRR